MKKFIYIVNILLLLLIPTVVVFGGNDGIIQYKSDTVSSTKMIKTTILIDRSSKKKEEEALRKKQEEEEQAKRELERARELERENAKQRLLAVKEPVKVVEKVGSLASSGGASDATLEYPNDKNDDNNVGGNTTVIIKPSEQVFVGAVLNGNMSAYGRDCCSSDPEKQGITASGYNIKTSGMYYNDATYGKVRILASDKNFPLYSVIKINDPIDGEYKAIVLDRGDKNIGIDRRFMFDLVVESQEWAKLYYGVHKNISFEILRLGK